MAGGASDDFLSHSARVYNVGGEAAERSGRRATAKFSQETSEAALGHVDDIAQTRKLTDTDFVDGKFTDPDVQERYERYLERKEKAGEAPRAPEDWKQASDHMASIRSQGREFETQRFEEFKQIADHAEEQITIRVTTPQGETVKIRVDAIGFDKETGALRIQEYKSSHTAPFTRNQTDVFPYFEQVGGTIAGEGKGIFKGGFEIPPGTPIEVIRPS